MPPRGDTAAAGTLPRVVTFLLAEVESVARLLETGGPAGAEALRQQRAIVTEAASSHGAVRIKTGGEGESLLAAFPSAGEAIGAATDMQRALGAQRWTVPLRVRVAIHTGEAELRGGDYYGVEVNRCARLRGIAAGGQTLVSQAAEAAAADALPEGVTLRSLGSHRLRDLGRPERVYQLCHPELPDDFPPLRSLDSLPTNLPVQLTTFIGRDQEMAEVEGLLGRTRLVTLTGAGGVGKTRLALHVAANLLDAYPDGVWIADLAPLSDAESVPQELAAVLGLREESNRSIIDTIIGAVRVRTMLLVLDNCEHLLDACASVATTLLQAGPGLRILATTREALGVRGEVAWRVPSLGVPDPAEATPLDRLAEAEAVRLFVDRARQVDPGFMLSEETARFVGQICHRLDGIALAIELAASRVKALTVSQIASRLDDRFRLLGGGTRPALERQRTLRALVDWSHELLSDDERTVLRRVSVFVGGFGLAGAERVCSDRLSPDEVLDGLLQLVAKSLAVVDPGHGEARYRLLQTIRQYALEKLLDAGETAVARALHRDHCLAVAERAAPELRRPGRKTWLDRLEADEDDLRAALDWSVGPDGDAESGLRLASALARFWKVRGRWTEGRRWLDGALRRPGDSDPALRASALRAAGALAWNQGDYQAADSMVSESLEIRRGLGDEAAVADSLAWLGWVRFALDEYDDAGRLFAEAIRAARASETSEVVGFAVGGLGWIAMAHDDYATARSNLERALAHARSDGDEEAAAFTLAGLGNIAFVSGELQEAGHLYAQSLMHARALGDRGGMGLALRGLGRTALAVQDAAAAREHLEAALAIHREMGGQYATWSLGELGNALFVLGELEAAEPLIDEAIALARESALTWPEAQALNFRGRLDRARGRIEHAAEAQREAIRLWHGIGERFGITGCLEELAWLAASAGDPVKGARLLGAAESLRSTIGAPIPPSARAGYDRERETLESSLGADAFRAAWERGKMMTLENAVTEALQRVGAGQ